LSSLQKSATSAQIYQALQVTCQILDSLICNNTYCLYFTTGSDEYLKTELAGGLIVLVSVCTGLQPGLVAFSDSLSANSSMEKVLS